MSQANQEEAKADVEAEIKSLETRLRNLKGSKGRNNHIKAHDPFEDSSPSNSNATGNSNWDWTATTNSAYNSDDDTLLQSQAQREMEAARRRQQEKDDAEFAMRLQSDDNALSWPASSDPPRSQPSSSTLPPGTQNAFHKMLGPPTKAEPGNRTDLSRKGAASASMPGAFPHMESSDSEIEVIAPELFSPSARSAQRSSSAIAHQASSTLNPRTFTPYKRPGYLHNGQSYSQTLSSGLNVYGSRATGYGDLTAIPGPSTLGGIASLHGNSFGTIDSFDRKGDYVPITDFRPPDEVFRPIPSHKFRLTHLSNSQKC